MAAAFHADPDRARVGLGPRRSHRAADGRDDRVVRVRPQRRGAVRLHHRPARDARQGLGSALGPPLAAAHHRAVCFRRVQRGSGGLADRRSRILGAAPKPGGAPAPDPARAHRALRARRVAAARRAPSEFTLALRLPGRRHLERRAAPRSRARGERHQDGVFHGALAPAARPHESPRGMVALARAPPARRPQPRTGPALGTGAGPVRAAPDPVPRGMKWLAVVLLCTACAGVGGPVPGAPAHHRERGFANTDPEFKFPSAWTVNKFRARRLWAALVGGGDMVTFPRVTNDGRALRENSAEPTVTWVGHATLLLQLDGVNVLTDPHWSERASPVSFAGPRRLAAPGLAFEDLPPIHLVVISHDHYDQLDAPTVKRLADTHRPLFLVPLG